MLLHRNCAEAGRNVIYSEVILTMHILMLDCFEVTLTMLLQLFDFHYNKCED